jgi:hypothetical protein
MMRVETRNILMALAIMLGLAALPVARANAGAAATGQQGETGYIVGEEGSGAIIGGLRYGEGTLFMKNGFRKKVYWQGPSIGMDFGGNGSRVLVLVYGLQHPNDLLARFAGIEGTAYVVGGLGVNFQQYANVKLAPIRTGLGFRLGLNAGYLKYSDRPQWNPF